MCSRPRKPQRKPKPSATELSGSKKNDESLRRKFFQRVAQQRVLVGVHGVEAGEDHGLEFFESGQGFERGTVVVGDGVADLGVGNVLDVGR